jgi:hypothetical protein
LKGGTVQILGEKTPNKPKFYSGINYEQTEVAEIWSPTFRAEGRLRVFENGVLWRIFGPKRDEVTSKWEKLHTEKINHLYSSRNIIRVIKLRRMRWAVHVA